MGLLQRLSIILAVIWILATGILQISGFNFQQ